MTSPTFSELPVAVIGAGPVGLAAAAQLHERGLSVVVYEAAEAAGAAVKSWGHTRLFSPWEFVVDQAALRLLATTGWKAPNAKKLPYGSELVEDYLLPLAATKELAPHIRYNSTVRAVSRQGMDRTRSTNRANTAFVLRIQTDGGIREEWARAVIDTSGTYGTPNPVTSSGLDPLGSEDIRDKISEALPDVLGADRAQFAGKATVVVGAGHSAANTLLKLATLAEQEPETRIMWVIRSTSPVRVYGSSEDELCARGDLGSAVHDLVRRDDITLIDSFEIENLEASPTGTIRVHGNRAGTHTVLEADRVVNATGFRPNFDMLREIRISVDEIVEAPRNLAPLIDPNVHSCGTVPPHGVAELTHPEPNFYIAGMKSYGRAPTFLLRTGYEQVRSIADELAGNHEAARRVQLLLPETGICSTKLPDSSGCITDDETAAAVGGCCSERSVTIRHLESSDWPAVHDIYLEGIKTGHATFEAEPPSWDEFNASKLADHRFIAVDNKGLILGWAAVSETSTRPSYRGVVEHSVYVASTARGYGVGQTLLKALIESTEAAGVWSLQSGIFPENTTSLALHEKHGFRRVGTRKNIARMTYGPLKGAWRDVILLERRSSQ